MENCDWLAGVYKRTKNYINFFEMIIKFHLKEGIVG